MPRTKDRTGERFGKLVVVEKTAKRTSSGNVIWKCRCDCGNFTEVSSTNLVGGHTTSCGCMRRIDLAGKRFGNLVVLSYAGNREEKVQWLCRCDCGTELKVDASALTTGHTTSCGCSRRGDIVGQRFGRLTVMAYDRFEKRRCLWRCYCDCGKETIVDTTSLLSGNTKSCGCLQVDIATEQCTTHGLSKTRIYKIWQKMLQRCENIFSDSYPYYGELGIEVCQEWHDVTVFYDWAITHGYEEHLSIDRINPFRGYTPDNCQWADKAQQSRNKREIYYRILEVTYREILTSCVSRDNIFYVEDYLTLVFTQKFWFDMFTKYNFTVDTERNSETLGIFFSEYLMQYLTFLDWAFDFYQGKITESFIPLPNHLLPGEPKPDLSYTNFCKVLEDYFKTLKE